MLFGGSSCFYTEEGSVRIVSASVIFFMLSYRVLDLVFTDIKLDSYIFHDFLNFLVAFVYKQLRRRGPDLV